MEKASRWKWWKLTLGGMTVRSQWNSYTANRHQLYGESAPAIRRIGPACVPQSAPWPLVCSPISTPRVFPNSGSTPAPRVFPNPPCHLSATSKIRPHGNQRNGSSPVEESKRKSHSNIGCLLGGVYIHTLYSSHARWSYRRRLESLLLWACVQCHV